MRRMALLLVVLTVVSGCQTKIVRHNRRVGPVATRVQTGGGLPVPSTASSSSPTPTRTFAGPLFVLRLTDEHGLHPQGIPVRITGPTSGTTLTNAKGEIEIFRAGTYRLAIVQGCGNAVQVFSGGNATAGVVDGRTTRGELKVEWRHRFTPAPPVFTDHDGPWPPSTDVTVQFSVLDRCTQQFAPNAAYPTFIFATSANVRVSRPPTLRSDGKHRGSVTLRCKAKGKVTLVAVDKANPTDTFDIARESSDYYGPPTCAS